MESNRDLSGLMWKINNHHTVNFQKGFKTPEEVFELLKKLDLKEEDEAIFHSRISTCGEVSPINCHPFVVSDNMDVISKISGRVSYPVMAHNGFFQYYTDRNSKFSDTFHFVKDFAGIPEITAILKRDPVLFHELFNHTHIRDTKLAFLFPDRDFAIMGDFVEDDGYFHSNGGYKKYVFDYGGSSARNFTKINNKVASRKLLATSNLNEGDEAYKDYLKERYGENFIANTPALVQSRALVGTSLTPIFTSDLLNFTPKQIKITESNYKDFWIRPQVQHNSVEKYGQYSIELFKDDCELFHIKQVGDNAIEDSIPKAFLNNCLIYSKAEVKERYKGLRSLFNVIVSYASTAGLPLGTPSASMLKKLREFVREKKDKDVYQYKTYGKIPIAELTNFLSQFAEEEISVEETFVKGTNSSVGASFTLNEFDFDNMIPKKADKEWDAIKKDVGVLTEAVIDNAEIVHEND